MPPSNTPPTNTSATFPPFADLCPTGRCLCPLPGRGPWNPSSWKDIRDIINVVGAAMLPYVDNWTQPQRDRVAMLFMQCAIAVGPSEDATIF
ncbi:hypothetical protein CF319_g879 [Tilletia indica]|uniref:Uncharacterized protein n=1 Tax=Tilletia indica TaxID=43049 RepID=A0A177TMV2_9BASI|nr:hypothetical protein CF319_g879 [Tilletia indica]KAE8246904.1 hypothetical protein A4X13_0g5578 [Tilletia indica]